MDGAVKTLRQGQAPAEKDNPVGSFNAAKIAAGEDLTGHDKQENRGGWMRFGAVQLFFIN
jgi:hypothetical protein